jgi:acyl-coenzyme A thioesterase PaaI-like protein
MMAEQYFEDLKLGKRLAVGEIGIFSGDRPEPVAHATATYSIRDR